jgi:hypothetical protein
VELEDPKIWNNAIDCGKQKLHGHFTMTRKLSLSYMKITSFLMCAMYGQCKSHSKRNDRMEKDISVRHFRQIFPSFINKSIIFFI